MPEHQHVSNWEKARTVSTLFASVFVPLAVALVGSWYSAAIKEQETQAELVATAIAILADDEGATAAPVSDRDTSAEQLNELLADLQSRVEAIESAPVGVRGARTKALLDELLNDLQPLAVIRQTPAQPQRNPLRDWAVQVVDTYSEVKLRGVQDGESNLADALIEARSSLPSRKN